MLFSPGKYSSLPGLPFPGDPDHYPTRDEVIAYLHEYAAKFELPIVTNARVVAVERPLTRPSATLSPQAGRGALAEDTSVSRMRGDEFQITLANGETLHTCSVIAATGSFGNPYIPDIPGRGDYRGRVLHAFDYREPSSFAGQRIVVVGGANSAVQIGYELARVARVTLALRTRIHWSPQRFLGKDGHFWLRITGLDYVRILSDQSTPVVDPGQYRRAIRAKRPDARKMFTRFTQNGVVWSNGEEENVDTVILATGYRPNLHYLDRLGALNAAGLPLQRAGVSTTVPGLYYVGLSGQRNFASATLRGVGPDAERVVRWLVQSL